MSVCFGPGAGSGSGSSSGSGGLSGEGKGDGDEDGEDGNRENSGPGEWKKPSDQWAVLAVQGTGPSRRYLVRFLGGAVVDEPTGKAPPETPKPKPAPPAPAGPIGCDAFCSRVHDTNDMCLVCGQRWGTHADHTCPGGGRGSFVPGPVPAGGLGGAFPLHAAPAAPAFGADPFNPVPAAPAFGGPAIPAGLAGLAAVTPAVRINHPDRSACFTPR